MAERRSSTSKSRMRPRVVKTGPCVCCQTGWRVDYKDTLHLKRFLTSRGKIRPREATGLCTKHQRQVARAVKRARVTALLAFTEV